MGMARLEQQRQQAGMPVVAVDDVGSKTQLFTGMEGRCSQEGKTLAVIGIGLIVLGVELRAVEILRAIDQIDTDSVQIQLMDTIIDVAAVLRSRQPSRGEQGSFVPAFDGLVEG